jgi:hypothetical protein
VAYPIALPWAVAAIPIVIHLRIDELSVMTDERALSSMILRLVALPTAAAFALAHAVAIPWIREARPGATSTWGKRAFVVTAIALGLLGVAAAVVGWATVLGSDGPISRIGWPGDTRAVTAERQTCERDVAGPGSGELALK